MGNRTFLYTTDRLPASADDDPDYAASVAEANNSLPLLWAVMLANPRLGSAQDYQQVFLPSVYGGIYAERAGAESRLFAVLEFLGRHPCLPDPARFAQQVEGVRGYLASLPGAAYSADLNEWFWLDDDALSPEQHLDRFARQCEVLWAQLQEAMVFDDFAGVERLLAFSPRDPGGTLGFACWSHRYFYGDADGGPSRLPFAAFCALPEPDWDEEMDRSDVEIGAGLFIFHEGERVGLRRADGTLLLPAEYDAINPFYADDLFAFIQRDELLGTIDRDGRILIDPCIVQVIDDDDGVRLVKADNFGFLNARGEWLTAARYQAATGFVHGMARVTLGKRHGFVNRDGAELFGDWRATDDFNAAGIAAVNTQDGWTLIDRHGSLLFPAAWRKLAFDDGLQAWIGSADDGSTTAWQPSGEFWFSGLYDEVTWQDSGGAAIVSRRGRFGVIPRQRAVPTIPLAYEDVNWVCPGAWAVTADDGAVSLLAEDGQILIGERFDDIDRIACVPELPDVLVPDDVVAVQTGDLIGVWSLSARRQVLPCEYESVVMLRTGQWAWLVLAASEGGHVIADASGKRVSEHRYDWIGAEYYGSLEADWHLGLLHAELERTWAQGQALAARRDGVDVRLYPDGREETELDLLLRQAAAAPPIVALQPLVMQLPLPARAPRPSAHAIAGVGDPDACYRISELYRDGAAVFADPRRGFRWLATAAAGGQPDAQYEYAYQLMQGELCAPDVEQALHIFEKLSAASREALNCMAYLYECKLRRRDAAQARALYEQAGAGGEAGLAIAQWNAGRCWRDGVGGRVNIDKALEYFEQAAFQGKSPVRAAYPGAASAAGELYLDKALAAHKAGRADDGAAWRKKAGSLLRQAVLEGDESACLLLAATLLGDYGGDKNVKGARLYLDRALRNPALMDQANALCRQHGV